MRAARLRRQPVRLRLEGASFDDWDWGMSVNLGDFQWDSRAPHENESPAELKTMIADKPTYGFAAFRIRWDQYSKWHNLLRQNSPNS